MQSQGYFVQRSEQNERDHGRQLKKMQQLVYNERLRPFSSTVIRYDLPEICLVCCEDFEHGQKLRLLPKCNHRFHLRCVDRLLNHTKYKCPLCGSRVVQTYDDTIDGI